MVKPLVWLLVVLTWEGALEESPPLSSPMRAAAVGLLELMSTGPLISMEWRWGGGARHGLCDMVSEVNEWRFLLFFFSPPGFCKPLAWGGQPAAADEDEEEEPEDEEEEGPSPADSPQPSKGLSNSMSCRAAVLN